MRGYDQEIKVSVDVKMAIAFGKEKLRSINSGESRVISANSRAQSNRLLA